MIVKTRIRNTIDYDNIPYNNKMIDKDKDNQGKSNVSLTPPPHPLAFSLSWIKMYCLGVLVSIPTTVKTRIRNTIP
jgi:hypothetical protein